MSAFTVPPSAQHTLLEHPSRRGSDGFCSVLQRSAALHCSCMPGPKAALLGWLPKATKSTPLLLRPMSRATFPAILGPPALALLGETNPGHLKERPNGATPPSPCSLTRSRWTSVVRSSSPIQPASGTVLPGRHFPGKGGCFVKLGQETFNGFLLELE